MKGTNNIRADALNRKVKLQGNQKVKKIILKIDKDNKIRYNHL